MRYLANSRITSMLVAVMGLMLLLMLSSNCVTVYPPEANNQTTTTQPTTPQIITQSFILEEGHNMTSVPIYLRTEQTLHMICTFNNQVGEIWISVIEPSGEGYGVTRDGFVQGANICEALFDAVIITFSPGDEVYLEHGLIFRDGYYMFMPHNDKQDKSSYAEVEMKYWIED